MNPERHINYLSSDRSQGGARSPERNASPEATLDSQIAEHFDSLYGQVDLDPGVDKRTLVEVATQRTQGIVKRENAIAQVTGSETFRHEAEQQKAMRGACAIGIAHCPDGGIPTIHIGGHMAGSTEILAGIPGTYRSPVTNQLLVESPWFADAITRRPQKPTSQLLEILIAHSHCGRMGQIQAERRNQGIQVGDPIAENLQLFEPAMEAIDGMYNTARQNGGESPVSRVAIRGVFFKEDMGFTVGYDTRTPVSSTDLLRSGLADELGKQLEVYGDPRLSQPGAFANNFLKLETQVARENLKTTIMRALMGNARNHKGLFAEGLSQAFQLDELKELNRDQRQAFAAFFARQIARSFLGGQYLPNQNGKHMHADHHEVALAVSLNGSHTVGRDDPEIQIFGSSPINAQDAGRHIVTKASIMDGTGDITHPYPLFISNAVAEGSRRGGSTEAQALQALKGDFSVILRHPGVASLVKEGKVAPIGVLNTNRSHTIRAVAQNVFF